MTSQLLRKDEAQPLPHQISDILRKKIECGEYQPGKKLKTIRQYANEFSVSPVTVIKALDILEEETLIERIPIKGVFVSGKLPYRDKVLKACFAFPEKELTFQPYTCENWCLNFELLQGLFCGSKQHNVELQFTYFEDNPSAELLEKQKTALREFDFAVFTGRQLKQLQEASAKERLTFDITAYPEDNTCGVIQVDYDREKMHVSLCHYLIESGCGSAVAVISGERRSKKNKAIHFLEDAKKAGIRLPGNGIWELDLKDPELQPKLRELLLRREAEFIFVETTDIVPEIYEAAFDAGLMPGRDFIITGIASGLTFTRLFPRLSYFRIPRFDMGMQIMEYAAESIRCGKAEKTLEQLEVEFVRGKDLRKKCR